MGRARVFVAVAILGVVVIALLLASIRVPNSGSYARIHEVFRERVCKALTLLAALEGRIGSPEGFERVYESCRAIDVNSLGQVSKQIVASVVFYLSLLAAIVFWERRVSAVFAGLVALVITGVLPFQLALQSMELGVILFLVSTMILVGYLRETGALRYLTVRIVTLSRGRPRALLALVIALSFVLSALVGEVASITYITLMLLELCELIDANPVPWVMIAVFATNLGSAATMIGNPIGLYIGMYFNLSFVDFLINAFPAAALSMLALLPIASSYLRRDLETMKALRERLEYLDPWAEARDRRELYFSLALFSATILAISLHVQIARALSAALSRILPYSVSVDPDAILVAAPLVSASIAMARCGHRARKIVEESVEWWTLLFFMFLFAESAALSYTGVTDKLAYLILRVSASHALASAGIVINAIVMIAAAIFSGFIDNMPIVVALSPIVSSIAALGIHGSATLPWALLFGGTMGGNLTVIGSTANIVAASMLEKSGIRIGFGQWLRIGVSVVATSMIISLAWISILIGARS